MTAQEIIEKVEELDIEVSDFAYGEMENPLEGVGSWKEVQQHGGEGEGDDWYSVKHFTDHDVYIKTQGFYTSYSGTGFENGFGNEVFPKEKTITVYE